MKAVIDTNVFVSSFFGGNPRQIINLWRDGFLTLCLSSAIVDEYVEVLTRLGLKDKKELKELLTLFSTGYNILFTTKTPKLNVVQNDPDDNKFIECAVALNAEVVISGDQHLLSLNEFNGIKILNPKDFLEMYG